MKKRIIIVTVVLILTGAGASWRWYENQKPPFEFVKGMEKVGSWHNGIDDIVWYACPADYDVVVSNATSELAGMGYTSSATNILIDSKVRSWCTFATFADGYNDQVAVVNDTCGFSTEGQGLVGVTKDGWVMITLVSERRPTFVDEVIGFFSISHPHDHHQLAGVPPVTNFPSSTTNTPIK